MLACSRMDFYVRVLVGEDDGDLLEGVVFGLVHGARDAVVEDVLEHGGDHAYGVPVGVGLHLPGHALFADEALEVVLGVDHIVSVVMRQSFIVSSSLIPPTQMLIPSLKASSNAPVWLSVSPV